MDGFSDDIYGLGLIMNYLLRFSPEPPNLEDGINADISKITEWSHLTEDGTLFNSFL